MVEIRQTEEFRAWLSGLRDSQAKQKIAVRIARLRHGNPGDVEPVGEGLSELRVHEGKGYRVYYMQRGKVLVVLLCGGDKKSQSKDIARAKKLAAEWENDNGT